MHLQPAGFNLIAADIADAIAHGGIRGHTVKINQRYFGLSGGLGNIFGALGIDRINNNHVHFPIDETLHLTQLLIYRPLGIFKLQFYIRVCFCSFDNVAA
ncbi:hypothetical protein D3C78_1485270 [compost metagenome]